MQLMIAAAPPLRQMACGTQLPIANAAYRIENGVLCALPMPPALRGGAMLLTGAAGPFSPETAAGVVQECRRRRYGTVIVPFPAAELTEALAQPLHRSGIALWVHEKCAHTAPGARVLVCTALSGGDIENRLSACCRAFGPDRIVLDLQRLRMDFPLPCPTGEGIPLTDEHPRCLHRLLRQAQGVGTHIGDEAHGALTLDVHALTRCDIVDVMLALLWCAGLDIPPLYD